MVVPSEVRAVPGVLLSLESWELCSSSSARAVPPSVQSQVCLSHWAGQECSMWDQVLVSLPGSH